MHLGAEVLKMLVGDAVEWTIYNDDYEGIIWHNSEPYITEEQFEQGKLDVPAWLEQKVVERQNKRETALNKLQELGLTEEDILLIIGG